MTTLPVCLPAAVAVCMAAAGVFAVGVVVGGWIDWRERKRPRAPNPELPFPALIASRRRPNPLPAVPSDIRPP